VVEAILVLPVVLMLTLGVAEYGYAFYLKHSLMTAAAVGVRAGILPTSSDTAVQTAISNQLALTNMKNIGYTITTVPASVNGCSSGTTVTVTISCTWGNAGVSPLPVALGGFGPTKQFSASASMIHE
jgi:Flp pilus assembly protein TadG